MKIIVTLTAVLTGLTALVTFVLMIVAALTKDFNLFVSAFLVCFASSCGLWVSVAIACALKKEDV